MKKTHSLDWLVTDLEPNERILLLDRIKSTMAPDTQLDSLTELSTNTSEKSIEESLRNESFFFKIWMMIKSFFLGLNIHVIYNEYRLLKLAKKIQHNFPDILNAKTLTTESGFYHKLLELRQVAHFFKKDILEYSEEEGAFYVFLGSLVIPDLYAKIEKEITPTENDDIIQSPSGFRTSLLRKLEDFFSDLPHNKKKQIYLAIQSLDWLRSFTSLPFERLITKFSATTLSCELYVLQKELNMFANVLCQCKEIEAEILEALYFFSIKKQIAMGKEVDTDKEVSEYMQEANKNIAIIKHFLRTVPICGLVAIANQSFFYIPQENTGSEDWFVKYKSQWRKIFDKKWENWLFNIRAEKVKSLICDYFKTKDYPLIQNRPWETVWNGIAYRKEYTLGFLFSFFSITYPKQHSILELIILKGEFSIKEEKANFVTEYNKMKHLSDSVLELNTKLSSDGIYGSVFSKIKSEAFRSIQEQSKMDSIMKAIESETMFFTTSWGNAVRNLKALLLKFTGEENGKKVGILSNLSILQSPDKHSIRHHITEIVQSLSRALEILQEVEALELT